jgi:hypothetical protein
MLAALLEASSAEDVVKAANRMSNACSASSSDAMVVDVIDTLEKGRKWKDEISYRRPSTTTYQR